MFPAYTLGAITTQIAVPAPSAIVVPTDMNVQSITLRGDADWSFHFDVADAGFPVVADAPITLPFDPRRQTIYLSSAGTSNVTIAFAGNPQPR